MGSSLFPVGQKVVFECKRTLSGIFRHREIDEILTVSFAYLRNLSSSWSFLKLIRLMIFRYYPKFSLYEGPL